MLVELLLLAVMGVVGASTDPAVAGIMEGTIVGGVDREG